MRTDNSRTRPPLKWAGGKFSIIEKILNILPEGDRLIEPFVGGGALFFNAPYKRFTINDKNQDLINFYRQLKKEKQGFIDYAKQYFTERYNCNDSYYRFRDEFNITNDVRLKSALFLYLNKHGYNGLCRYNLQGKLNVPFGRFKKPNFAERELQQLAKKLNTATIHCKDFEQILKSAKPGDIVYCDPPYIPLSKTSSFTTYSSGGFSYQDHERLSLAAREACSRGAFVLISNHQTPYDDILYPDAEIISFPVRRSISCNGKKRDDANEILVIYQNQ